MPNPEKSPLVGVIMGSDSDLPKMMPAGDILDSFGVENEFRIISAHRTPDRMDHYAKTAHERGLRVLIAAAGGSAHLQGMSASHTHLPVLGVAIESQPDVQNSALGSMVSMPPGIPLATMGRNESGAKNAALEAVRILSGNNPDLQAAYLEFVAKQAAEVVGKDDEIQRLGRKAYFDLHFPEKKS
jgi:phosphoribosylaminoimidazole carboxylase PurE protein